ncbi:TPM domain-containing protein [Gracilibacillus sp. HCP3S3_G5_1]|uniref:TPM domain-containing protein n=1 Tax=unclassified Gracilibacillus TaxID=2625209 RepID=UPI003F8BCE5E
MKKVLSSFYLLLLFSLLLFTPVMAEEQYIYDNANIFSDAEKAELEQLAAEYRGENETDFLILTADDLENKNATEYADDFYDEVAPGYDQAQGATVILTIDMENREVDLGGYGDVQEYLSDERLTQIREYITPALSEGNYVKAAQQFFDKVEQYLGVNPYINPDSIFLKTWFQLVVAVLIGAVVVGSMIFNMGGRVTVNHQTYMDPQNSRVVKKRDTYIRKSVRKTKIQKNNSRSGGGSGGMTSGGHSRTGSRGGF